MAAQADVATLKYEQALAELESLIQRLERGDVALDEAVACYQRGSALAQRCAELLDRTEATVLQLVVGGGGADEERPLRAVEDEPAPVRARPAIAGQAVAGSAERPMAPPPPGSPARARSVPAPARPATGVPPSPSSPRPAPTTPPPGLFSEHPGEDDSAFDLDDIPF